uniref:PIPK domain-containing protein n=1 Tax=Noctiluca scintillans TaxID=2966 RepID=A0A7S1F1G5_NOCSC|mmetsp:Transcript_26007/g.68256  ORF Transcript_26007/g.68256 Transcript_26007/m.68256 type:complete len:761 (+) Transcript_26007:49-2331(+)
MLCLSLLLGVAVVVARRVDVPDEELDIVSPDGQRRHSLFPTSLTQSAEADSKTPPGQLSDVPSGEGLFEAAHVSAVTEAAHADESKATRYVDASDMVRLIEALEAGEEEAGATRDMDLWEDEDTEEGVEDEGRVVAAARMARMALETDGGEVSGVDSANAALSSGTALAEQDAEIGCRISSGADDVAPYNMSLSKIMCAECVAKRCQWCTLTQTCISYHWRTCPTRKGMADVDMPIKDESSQKCETDPSPGLEWVYKSYGDDLFQDIKNLDARHCYQHLMKMDLTDTEVVTDRWKDNDRRAKSEALGRWGCISSLAREAVIDAVGHLPKHRQGELLMNAENTDGWKVKGWRPQICSYSVLTSCEVAVYGNARFAQLRKDVAAPNHGPPRDVSAMILQSILSGPLRMDDPGTGKSGSSFGSTWDGAFKLKFGLKSSTSMNEPKNLLMLMKGTDKTFGLLEHFKRNRMSLLNRYYGLFKVKFGTYSEYILVMQDGTYGYSQKVSMQYRVNYEVYDLKGKSRVQNTKQTKTTDAQGLTMNKTLLNGDFREREQNRMYMKSEQCRLFRNQLKITCDYLDALDIIDYSMFVGIAKANPPSCPATPGEPFCFEALGSNTRYVYTVSIIDYLDIFNSYKQVESRLHNGKFRHYAQKMIDLGDTMCPDEPRQHDQLHGGDTHSYLITFVFLVFVGIFAICACGCGAFWYVSANDGSHPAERTAHHGDEGAFSERTQPHAPPPSSPRPPYSAYHAPYGAYQTPHANWQG